MKTIPDEFSVDITQNHINCGKRRDAWECPVAIAIREKMGLHTGGVSVASNVYINDKGYYSPIDERKYLEFIVAFDCKNNVTPTTMNFKKE